LQTASAGNRFAGLDHLRALAIIIVFIFHYNIFGHPPGLNEYFGSWGWTGVDLFFVLSGYLIGGQLFAKLSRDQPIHYGEFYLKRSLRILPAYFAVLLIYFTVPQFIERSTLPPFWRFLTFTQNFGLDLSQHGAFSHAWSLCIEEQFYLLLPLLLLLLKSRRSLWLLPFLFLAGLAVRSFIWYDILPYEPSFGKTYYRLIYYPTWSRLDGLIAGVALSALYYFKPATWQKLTRKGNTLTLIAGAMVAGAWFLTHGEHQYEMQGAIFGYPAISIAYGALVLAALSPASFLYRYSSRITKWIATLSYSIYLTHKQLIHLTHELLEPRGIGNDTYLSFAICVIVSLLGAGLLHIVIERPFLRLRDRILGRKSKSPSTQQNKFSVPL
jgi:peptidoglycan/LPS O-acetylase OafA/YrhL